MFLLVIKTNYATFLSQNCYYLVLKKELHIVSLRVPLPLTIGANYDLFNKLQALSDDGVIIHLHCFTNGANEEQILLNRLCKTVHYYKRTKKLHLGIPYIVSSRISEALYQNLLKDDLPILVEGTHCTGLVFDKRFANRKIVMRAHNVEYLYYKGLAKSTTHGFKRLYYWIESLLLKKYESKLAKKVPILALTHSDLDYFVEVYKCKKATFLPIFYESKTNIPTQNGSFCLYHGNLEVPENEKAVMWLLQNVFNDLEIPFVVAGRNPSKKLIHESHKNMHTCIAANPSETEMNDLVNKAQINVLPSINATGIKLKLLNSLFNGRFCITNMKGANGFDVKELFLYADDAASMKAQIKEYFEKPFTNDYIDTRIALLQNHYNLHNNAVSLEKIFW